MGSCMGRKTDVRINAIMPSQKFGQNNALLDRWSEQQVRLLNLKFNKYKTTEGLDFEAFEKLIKDSSYLPKSSIKNLFRQFAVSGFQVLNFRNFCILIAQIFLSSKKDKAELVFKIFNESTSGQWTENEKHAFIGSYKEYLKTNSKSSDFTYNGGVLLQNFIDWAVKNMDMLYIMKPFELIPSPEKEKVLINELLQEMKPASGVSVCLISSIWWETWKNYVAFEKVAEIPLNMNRSINNGDRPVAIDNSRLIVTGEKLKPNLRPDKDFVGVSERVWDTLHEWYDGGPKILRTYTLQSKILALDLYPYILIIIPVANNGYPTTAQHTLQFSNSQKMEEVLHKAASILKKPAEVSRIWVKTRAGLKVPALNETIEQSRLTEEEILFETRVSERGKTFWPRDLIKEKLSSNPSNTITASSSNSEDSKRNTEAKKMTFVRATKSPGIIGLLNLGNTCYFNCIVQALVHTPLLQDFFATSNIGSYMNKKVEANASLAVELSNLCKEMWSAFTPKVNPIKLYKEFISHFPMFDDKSQHDCHEFLSMFLDSLHEELRREGDEESKSTVILENPENRQIEIMESERQWQLLQGTQGSIITDMCAGQTKTTLTCTACGSTRILFEIFTNLSLPIPYINTIPVYITIITWSSPVIKIAMMASKHFKVKELIEQISSFCGLPTDRILLFDSSFNLSYRTLENSPEFSLANLGVSNKAEFFACEGRKSVESCEEQGKRVRPYGKDTFEVNDQVDIFNSKGRWVPGTIRDVKAGPEYQVEYDYIEGREWRSVSHISRFRTYTSYIDPCIYTIFITNISSSSRKRLGFPMALSIGSWYTLNDLYALAFNLLMKLCTKDQKPAQDPFKMSILDSNTLRCGLCSNSCTGCSLIKSKQEIRSLFQNSKRICIVAEWAERYFSENIILDSSVNHVREKEKLIGKTIDIETCLNEFTKEEKLEMKCEKCSNNSMKMKMEIWRTPDILILSFKRFTYSNGVIEKINSFVNFPFLGFDISSFVKSTEANKSLLSTLSAQNSYDLYAVVLHSGSVTSGHYTSLIKLQQGWMLFDDDCLLELKESPENSNLLSSSYLLMYRRRRFSSSNVINLTYNSV